MAERALLTGEYLVLSLIAVRNMHGYDMVSFLTGQGLTAVCPVEQSTLYTYLRNVEARGYVEWSEERVGQRPPRKIYRLTQRGREVVDAWLREPVARMREVRRDFLLKLFFLGELDPAAQARLLDAQIEVCEAYRMHVAARSLDAWGFERLVAFSKLSAAEATLDWLRGYAAETPA